MTMKKRTLKASSGPWKRAAANFAAHFQTVVTASSCRYLDDPTILSQRDQINSAMTRRDAAVYLNVCQDAAATLALFIAAQRHGARTRDYPWMPEVR
jgi:hypothetical protein